MAVYGSEGGLLRICTAGSVDDGKSTLIGRLLYDSRSVYEDQVHSVEKASKNRTAGPIDFSLFTDGLRAEREQRITIDVAYRYFATARRKFILADTPGHEQYTRNMATGASTADLALVLVDARKGVLEQSRRHAFIASLLRIPHLVVCVNKMDLVDWDQATYERIAADFRDFAARLDVTDVAAIPVSALLGDNVVDRSTNMDWYSGPTLLHHLEHVYIGSDRNLSTTVRSRNMVRYDIPRNFGGLSASLFVAPRAGGTLVNAPLTATAQSAAGGLALAVTVVTVLATLSLVLFFTIGQPFGSINVVLVTGELSGPAERVRAGLRQ